MFLFCKDEKKAKDKAYLCFPAPGPQFVVKVCCNYSVYFYSVSREKKYLVQIWQM